MAPDQATLFADAVTLAYCQPYVSAFFNFHLADTARGRRILSSGDTFTDAFDPLVVHLYVVAPPEG